MRSARPLWISWDAVLCGVAIDARHGAAKSSVMNGMTRRIQSFWAGMRICQQSIGKAAAKFDFAKISEKPITFLGFVIPDKTSPILKMTPDKNPTRFFIITL